MLRSFILLIMILSSCILVIDGTPVQPRAKVVKEIKSALFKGIGTYYEVPGVGSCGKEDNDDELVVAVNQPQMKNGANPNQNPECEKKVIITGEQGKSTTARIVDTCPTCPRGNLDMSPKVFKTICGNLEKGKCKIKWRFQDN
ncbi:uncharacterized protein BX664DRAFT_366151 [Halteromyces radiatus]|uniref:uncharacterized protein n=1 Tax=Halteromyces radiatus TaxID=101107 RepID=UPI0022201998|nr:uncharacterized protein BX664DRAFT_366151 [Halteromyces radiatus]KAI8086756.1 hypothetical protein BX664DRAFT_366151 [Halteromyces radiatus]